MKKVFLLFLLLGFGVKISTQHSMNIYSGSKCCPKDDLKHLWQDRMYSLKEKILMLPPQLSLEESGGDGIVIYYFDKTILDPSSIGEDPTKRSFKFDFTVDTINCEFTVRKVSVGKVKNLILEENFTFKNSEEALVDIFTGDFYLFEHGVSALFPVSIVLNQLDEGYQILSDYLDAKIR